MSRHDLIIIARTDIEQELFLIFIIILLILRVIHQILILFSFRLHVGTTHIYNIIVVLIFIFVILILTRLDIILLAYFILLSLRHIDSLSYFPQFIHFIFHLLCHIIVFIIYSNFLIILQL